MELEKTTTFKPIEWAWSVQIAHREKYGCLHVRVLPTTNLFFMVHCPIHGPVDEDGEPVSEANSREEPE